MLNISPLSCNGFFFTVTSNSLTPIMRCVFQRILSLQNINILDPNVWMLTG